MSALNVPFTDHGTTQQSGNDDGARIAVATDSAGTGLGQLAASPSPGTGRAYIGVFAGTQRTGGYSVRVERIERNGDRLVVRAAFTAPPSDALTIQVITSPAQLVSVDAQGVSGAREAVLLDQSGSERARAAVPQSRP